MHSISLLKLLGFQRTISQKVAS